MVRISERDDVMVSRVQPGHRGSHVVGLRAAVHEIHVVQGLGEGGSQSLSVFMDLDTYDTDEMRLVSN